MKTNEAWNHASLSLELEGRNRRIPGSGLAKTVRPRFYKRCPLWKWDGEQMRKKYEVWPLCVCTHFCLCTYIHVNTHTHIHTHAYLQKSKNFKIWKLKTNGIKILKCKHKWKCELEYQPKWNERLQALRRTLKDFAQRQKEKFMKKI